MSKRYDHMAVKSGEEMDVVHKGSRRHLVWRTGEIAKIKRAIRKRARAMAKADLRNHLS